MKNLKFKGFDWSEMFAIWGMKEMDQPRKLNRLLTALLYTTADPTDEEKWKAKQVRRYLRALGRASRSYDANIFHAMAGIKDDWTMLCWVTRNLETLWS